jgi:choline monooxygenase
VSIFDELAEHAALPFKGGRMMPLEVYRSAEVLAAERQAIFAREWTCVGRTADVPHRGDYLTAEIPVASADVVATEFAQDRSAAVHRSIIVIRGEGGELAAFDNVCIHRGAQLLDGCGNEARITCPYHAWVFRLDGQLIGGPYMNQTVDEQGNPFDPSAHRLVALRLEVWEGFIFVNQDATAAPLAPRLSGLTDVVAPFQMAGYIPVHSQVDVWATNWKLLVENFMDAYHIFKVHKASFGANGDNTLDTNMFPGTDHWAHHAVIHEAGDDIAHPSNTTLEQPWRKSVVLGAVFPTHVMQLQPDFLWYLQISPLGTGHCRIRWDVSVAPEMLAAQPDAEAYVAKVLALLHQVNAEDQPVVEGIRRTAESGQQFPRGPLSYLERNVYDFDRYVTRAVTRARA